MKFKADALIYVISTVLSVWITTTTNYEIVNYQHGTELIRSGALFVRIFSWFHEKTPFLAVTNEETQSLDTNDTVAPDSLVKLLLKAVSFQLNNSTDIRYFDKGIHWKILGNATPHPQISSFSCSFGENWPNNTLPPSPPSQKSSIRSSVTEYSHPPENPGTRPDFTEKMPPPPT